MLVLRGAAGLGKTALLRYAVQQAVGYRILSTVGVESDMELPYAGLHLLCVSVLDRVGRLPLPQRDALETAFGRRTGPRPDRFLVGLATLSLLSDVAEESPLLCVIDDAQWLDHSSIQVLTFVARRMEVESIAFLFAESETERLKALEGFPELLLTGLPDPEARELLHSAISGPLDESVSERIIAETHGNPLALLELTRGMSNDELAGGFGVTAAHELSDRIERSFRDHVRGLPVESRQLLLVAAADPVGDPTLLWRAASELGLAEGAAEPLESSGLLSIGTRVVFRHPLLRSAIYRDASQSERRLVHRALAAATDAETDPDRRAWHLSFAVEGFDAEIARELERSAVRARERGGLAATAAFLEKATILTFDSRKRAERALAAAAVKFEAGAPDAALRLLGIAELGSLDEALLGRLERLRAELQFALRRGNDAPGLLLGAARRLEPVDHRLSRETYLEAFATATIVGRLGEVGMVEVAEEARRALPVPRRPRATDLLLHGLVVRFTEGYAAAREPLGRALNAFAVAGEDANQWLSLAYRIARDLWDDETWHALTTLHVQLAREAGALTVLPFALTYRAGVEVHTGDFAAASHLVAEADSIWAATGFQPVVDSTLMLAAWQGQEQRALELLESARQDSLDRGEGYALTVADYSAAVLCNALGRYEEALAAVEDASRLDELGLTGWVLVELIEAASRSNQRSLAVRALEQLSARTRSTGTDWALGIQARSQALVAEDAIAEALHREAIERLSRSRIKTHLARTHLAYGDGLRRHGRPSDARPPLRTAHELFAAMGAEAFAARARRELVASGGRARLRSPAARDQLTAREAQIALLARDGCSNPEIGARLFISPRTVEYHLHKVFAKLAIGSRGELRVALADRE